MQTEIILDSLTSENIRQLIGELDSETMLTIEFPHTDESIDTAHKYEGRGENDS